MRNFKIILLVAVNLIMLPLHVIFVVMAATASFIPIYPTRTALKNFKNQLGANQLKAHFLLVGVYLNYCYYIYEIYFLNFLGLALFKNLEECTEFIDQTSRKHNFQNGQVLGPVILGAHLSNFELLGFQVSRRLKNKFGIPVYALTKPSKSKIISRFWRWFRPLMGFHVIETNGSDLLIKMKSCALQGNSISLIADQKPKKDGLFLKFFGDFCAFPTRGLALLVELKMPVVFLGSRRIFPGYSEIYYCEENSAQYIDGKGNFIPFQPAEICSDGSQPVENKVTTIMAAYAGWLESVIQKSLHQWFWDYKKWSRKPNFDVAPVPDQDKTLQKVI